MAIYQPTNIEIGRASGFAGSLVDSTTLKTGAPILKELTGVLDQYIALNAKVRTRQRLSANSPTLSLSVEVPAKRNGISSTILKRRDVGVPELDSSAHEPMKP